MHTIIYLLTPKNDGTKRSENGTLYIIDLSTQISSIYGFNKQLFRKLLK